MNIKLKFAKGTGKDLQKLYQIIWEHLLEELLKNYDLIEKRKLPKNWGKIKVGGKLVKF